MSTPDESAIYDALAARLAHALLPLGDKAKVLTASEAKKLKVLPDQYALPFLSPRFGENPRLTGQSDIRAWRVVIGCGGTFDSNARKVRSAVERELRDTRLVIGEHKALLKHEDSEVLGEANGRVYGTTTYTFAF